MFLSIREHFGLVYTEVQPWTGHEQVVELGMLDEL